MAFGSALNFNMGYDPPEYTTPVVRGGDVTSADFDSDGKLDIAIGNDYAYYVSVLQNIGSPGNIAFSLPDTFSTSYKPVAIIAEDFDGDGRPDIAVPVGVLLNCSSNGKIDFVLVDNVYRGTTSFAATDFDGDGKIDLVGASNLSISHNTSTIGKISFDLISGKFPWEIYGKLVAVADCDGDRKTDIVITTTGGMIDVLRNISSPADINFAPPIEYTSIREARAVAVYDLSGDGRPDIIVNNQDYVVAVLINKGSPGFLDFQPAFPGTVVLGNSRDICVADFDGDGHPDLAASRDDQAEVCVLRTSPTPFSTSVAHRENVPLGYELSQNYPNPFNPDTEICYQLPEACHVTLKIYNLLGQEIRILVNQRQVAGNYIVHWDGRDVQGQNLASGIYLYRIEAGSFVASRKLTIIR
jgi:hypothetical protein